MKSTILAVVICLIAQVVFPQQKRGGSSPAYGFSEQPEVVSDEIKGTEDLDNYELELMPGQKFDGWYFFWSYGGPLVAGFNESPEADWLSLDHYNFTSTGCSDIVPVRFSFTAPTEEGDYETVLIDNLGNWSDLKVRIRVTSNPASAFKRSFGMNKDSITYRHFTRWSPLNFSDNTCVMDYFPDLTADILYTFNPSKPWLKISPSSGQLQRNTIFDFRSTIKKTQFDSTWVIYTREFASFPAFLHYYVKETEPVQYTYTLFTADTSWHISNNHTLQFNGENFINTGYYPSSSSKTLMFWVRFDTISLQACGANDLLDHRFYLGITDDNSLFAGLGDNYTPLTSLNSIPGKWYNMVLTTSRDADSAIVYVNATEVSRWKYSFSGESKASLFIGAKNDYTDTANFVRGFIEEVQVWEKPLTRKEIIYHMFHSITYSATDLIIHYRFDEGWGNFTKNLVDNYYNGILYYDPIWTVGILRPNDGSFWDDGNEGDEHPDFPSIEEYIQEGADTLMLRCLPNPFNSSADIFYYLPGNGKVLLELYDLYGTLVRTLANTEMISGIQTYNLKDATLPAGMYIVRLAFSNSEGNYVKSIKIIRIDKLL